MTNPSHVRSTRPIDPSLPQYESLVHMLAAAVDTHPQVTAVINEDRRITYAEFGHAVVGLAHQLVAAGAKRGRTRHT